MLINVDGLPETCAAINELRPWIGIYAREYLNFHLQNKKDAINSEINHLVMQLLPRVDHLVESVCYKLQIGNEVVYGLGSTTNHDDLFLFVITQNSAIVLSKVGDLTIPAPLPRDEMRSQIWPILINIVDENKTDELSAIPLLLAYHIGENDLPHVNNYIKNARNCGDTPCIFVFAVSQDDKAGGLATLSSFPPTINSQANRVALKYCGVAGSA